MEIQSVRDGAIFFADKASFRVPSFADEFLRKIEELYGAKLDPKKVTNSTTFGNGTGKVSILSFGPSVTLLDNRKVELELRKVVDVKSGKDFTLHRDVSSVVAFVFDRSKACLVYKLHGAFEAVRIEPNGNNSWRATYDLP